MILSREPVLSTLLVLSEVWPNLCDHVDVCDEDDRINDIAIK
jgi:hypothetical protein